MSESRRHTVIGVFGSYDMPLLAVEIGAEIARANQILLTGGDDPSQGNPENIEKAAVKDSALYGATTVANPQVLAPWIRLPCHTGSGTACCAPCSFSTTRSGLALITYIGHKRNYLEACLCDVAIAVPGGAGTQSEVMFTLTLKKPVIFIGQQWLQTYPLGGSHRLQDLLRDAYARVGVGTSGNGVLDALMHQNQVRRALADLPAYAYLPAPAMCDAVQTAQRAVACAQVLSAGHGRTGAFPDLEEPQYLNAKTAYESWLRDIDDRLR